MSSLPNAIAATLVRLVVRDERDDPRYAEASRRMAHAIVQQHADITAAVARGENVGVYAEAIR